MFRDEPVLHGEHGFDHASNTGGGFQVADVGLDRADQQRSIRRASDSVSCGRRADLDRIAYLGPRSVGLHIVHFGRAKSCSAKRLLYDSLLRRSARNGQARARPVLVQRRAPDHSPDAVAVGLRCGKPLEDHDAASLAPDVSVGSSVEGGAATVG